MLIIDGRKLNGKKTNEINYKKVIKYLDKYAPCTQSAIVKATGLSRQTINKHIKRMRLEQENEEAPNNVEN